MGQLTAHPIALKPEYENDSIAQGVKALLQLCDAHQGGSTFPINHFLLSLYDGGRWAPDMQLLCWRLDKEHFETVLAVMRGYAERGRELHTYFVNGDKLFESIAKVVQLREPNGFIGDDQVLEFGQYVQALLDEFAEREGAGAARRRIARAKADGFFKRQEDDPASRTVGCLRKDAERLAMRY